MPDAQEKKKKKELSSETTDALLVAMAQAIRLLLPGEHELDDAIAAALKELGS